MDLRLSVGGRVTVNLALANAHGMINEIPAKIRNGHMKLTYKGYYAPSEKTQVGDDGIVKRTLEFGIVNDHEGNQFKVPRILLVPVYNIKKFKRVEKEIHLSE